jgi:hypothetical protein
MPDLPHLLFECPLCQSFPQTLFQTLNELSNHRVEQHAVPLPDDWETRQGWTPHARLTDFRPPYHRRWHGRLLPQNGREP